jgi:hypothetical protein
MGSLDCNYLNLLQDNYTDYPVFVETGTNKGKTIFEMEKLFEKLFTIELHEGKYNYCKNKYKGNKINFVLGDSIIKLKELVSNIKNNTIFFLDAHYMTGNSAKGIKECPIYEEVIHINNIFTPNAIIIIDDCRLFNKKSKKNMYNEQIDWSDINTNNILKIVKNRLIKTYFLDSDFSKNDRLILHLDAIK